MRPIEHPHLRIGYLIFPFVQCPHIGSDPVRFQLAGLGMKIQRFPVIPPNGGQFFFQPVPILINQRVGRRQNLGSRPVILI